MENEEKITPEILMRVLDGLRKEIGTMMRAFGINHLNYTERQLEAIERLIDDKFPEGHRPQPTTILPFAFYLGECVIRNVPGAKWEILDNPSSVSDIVVRVPNNKGSVLHYVYPFTRTIKYWKDRTDRMSTMLRMTTYMGEIELSAEYQKKRIGQDGWIQTFYGDCYRVMLGDPETKEKMNNVSYMQAMDKMEKGKNDGRENKQ
jgi:hypothetical protein